MNTCASCVWFDRFTADERSAEMPGTTADMTPSLLTEVMREHMRRMAIERAQWVINQPLMTEQLARIVHG